jgi:hypothetical protein
MRRGVARSPEVNLVMAPILKDLRDRKIVVNTLYVKSEHNLADAPSRGNYSLPTPGEVVAAADERQGGSGAAFVKSSS